MKSIHKIITAFNHAIRTAAAQRGNSKVFSRKSLLTLETLIRLLIGAEGGSLYRILHTTGIAVTASAVSQRRAQVDPTIFRAIFDSFDSD